MFSSYHRQAKLGLQISFHPSIICIQHEAETSPSSHLQTFQGKTNTFPSQLKEAVSAACPGSLPGFPPEGCATKEVQHSQNFFALAGVTKPKTPAGDNRYHVFC